MPKDQLRDTESIKVGDTKTRVTNQCARTWLIHTYSIPHTSPQAESLLKSITSQKNVRTVGYLPKLYIFFTPHNTSNL